MASLTSSLLAIALFSSLLLSPSSSQSTCASQKFKKASATFATCTDLPALGAQLHYTYNASNSSLSIAFVAAPAQPEGWVAWAINPTSTGMVGSQALIAFNDNGRLTVKTFDVKSYSDIEDGKLSFDVWDLSAESDGKNFVIFGTVAMPAKATSVNQVWQAGPSVTDGEPDRHLIQGDNLKSMGVLSLEGGSAAGPVAGGGDGNAPSGSTSGEAPKSTGYRNVRWVGPIALMVLLVVVDFLI